MATELHDTEQCLRLGREVLRMVAEHQNPNTPIPDQREM